jgi:hypothetical protein
MAPLQTVRVEPGATVCDTQETPHDQGRDIHIPELPPFQIRSAILTHVLPFLIFVVSFFCFYPMLEGGDPYYLSLF